MPETPVSRFRINQRAKERMERLRKLTQKTDSEIIEDAIAHLLGSLERDLPTYITAPSDRVKSHKRGGDAA